MSGGRWSKGQSAAISARDLPVLVSAGAGSGKTSVLVERVLRRILEDGVDLDRILMVTFTEAAAAEMRERIARALRERNARRPLEQLDRAQISTLHSFCLQVLRAGSIGLPVDPGFRVADAEESAWLRERVLDELLEAWYSSDDPEAVEALRTYGGFRSEGDARSRILFLYEFSRSQPQPGEWLDGAVLGLARDAAVPLRDTRFADLFFGGLSDRLSAALTALGEAAGLCRRPGGPEPYLERLEEDLEMVGSALASVRARDLGRAREILRRGFPGFARAPDANPFLKRRAAALRKRAKDGLDALAGFFLRTDEELAADLRSAVPLLSGMSRVVADFSSRFARAKAERGVVDFGDLEHYSLSLLRGPDGRPTPLADEFSGRFEEILVDEYQDISPVQDAILTALAREGGGNLFQVGDVKQSIYRFRMAEPGLFIGRYKAYEARGGRVVDLQDNFRSRGEVVNAVNHVFGRIFSPILGGLRYDERARMIPCAPYPERAQGCSVSGRTELHLVETGNGEGRDPLFGAEPEDESAFAQDEDAGDGDGPSESGAAQAAGLIRGAEREAHAIGRRLLDLKRAGCSVFDRDSGTYRELRWGDVAILLRSARGRAETVAQVFRSIGIPVAAQSGGIKDTVEQRLALSFLAAVDNPRQDIPLAAILRAPTTGWTTTELARVRAAAARGDLYSAIAAASREDGAFFSEFPDLSRKAGQFLARLDGWRDAVRSRPVAEAVSTVLEESGLIPFCAGLPYGPERRAALLDLVRRAEEFDRIHGGTFGDFMRYVEESGGRTSAGEDDGTLGAGGDVVRVMTVHRSKGLEFPVVVVAGLGAEFRLPDSGVLLSAHRTLGLGPRAVSLEHRQTWPTAASLALETAERREALAEEARILYVAFTRARERLILFGSAKDPGALWERWTGDSPHVRGGAKDGPSESALLQAGTALDWVGPAVAAEADDGGDPLFDVKFWEAGLFEIDPPVANSAGEKADRRPTLDARAVSRLDPGAVPELRAEHGPGWLCRMTFRPGNPPAVVPAKLSVTEWKDRLADSEPEPEVPRAFSEPEAAARFDARPRFLSAAADLTPAERGSALHIAMQKVDLRLPLFEEEAVERELARLRDAGFLSEAAWSAVRPSQVAGFFRSRVGRSILAAPERVRREVRFVTGVPASWASGGPLLDGGSGEFPVVVQGMADCVRIDEDGLVLVDYKTDRPRRDPAEAAAPHLEQMSLYRMALARAFGRPVKETYLYFVHTEALVRIGESGRAALWRGDVPTGEGAD